MSRTAIVSSLQRDRELMTLRRPAVVPSVCRCATGSLQASGACRHPTGVLQDKRDEVWGGRKLKKARASTTKRNVHFPAAPCNSSRSIVASKLLTPRATRPTDQSHDCARWRAIRLFCLDQMAWQTTGIAVEVHGAGQGSGLWLVCQVLP
jgi:hypothetical protein